MRHFGLLFVGVVLGVCTIASGQDDDRSVVNAYKTDSQPTIDGTIDAGEWDDAGPWIMVTSTSANAQLGDDEEDADVFGGDADASYRFKAMWEEDTFNFFVLYEVFDDIAATEEPREERVWERDQIETFIDGTSLEGDDDPLTYHWWDNGGETYGKLGVNRENLFEGNSGTMTDDQELWNDYDSNAPLLSVSATGDTGNAGDYIIELGVTLEAMWDDFENFPFEDTPTDEAGHIVEDSTTIKFTNSMSDDDDFDLEGTDRSSTLTYYREIDGVAGQWDQSNYFADLVFTGKFDGVIIEPVVGDCNGDGILDAGDLSCITTIAERDAVLEALNTLPGDLDGNGDVAFADFLVLSNNFSEDLPSYTDGNIDLAGGVEFADFLVMSNNFGKTTGGVAAVPEPNSLVVFWCGLLAMVPRRRGQRREC